MRKLFSGVLYTYIEWLRSPRQFIFITEIILLLQFVIRPIVVFTQRKGALLNVFEPFLLLFSVPVMVCVLFFSFFLLIGDFPKILPAHVYIIPRIGRMKWLAGQFVFALLAAATYFGALFLACAIYVSRISYFANGWSPVYQELLHADHSQLDGLGVIILPTSDLLYSSRPYDALPNTFFLLLLMSILFMQIICIFSLQKRKLVGVIVSLSLLGAGYALMSTGSPIRWAFPLSNGILRDHFVRLITIYPVLYSYIYFYVLISIGTIICFYSAKRYSFSFSLEEP